jgi:hypothetical protein
LVVIGEQNLLPARGSKAWAIVWILIDDHPLSVNEVRGGSLPCSRGRRLKLLPARTVMSPWAARPIRGGQALDPLPMSDWKSIGWHGNPAVTGRTRMLSIGRPIPRATEALLQAGSGRFPAGCSISAPARPRTSGLCRAVSDRSEWLSRWKHSAAEVNRRGLCAVRSAARPNGARPTTNVACAPAASSAQPCCCHCSTARSAASDSSAIGSS